MSNKLTNDQKNHLFLEHLKNTKPVYHEDVLNAIEKHLGTTDRSDVHFMIYADDAKPLHSYVERRSSLFQTLWFDYIAFRPV